MNAARKPREVLDKSDVCDRILNEARKQIEEKKMQNNNADRQ